jgi:hypothetical protein
VQRVAGLIEVDRGMPADRIGTVQDVGDRVRVDATNFMQMALAASSTDGLNFMDDVGYGPGDPGSVSTSLGVVPAVWVDDTYRGLASRLSHKLRANAGRTPGLQSPFPPIGAGGSPCLFLECGREVLRRGKSTLQCDFAYRACPEVNSVSSLARSAELIRTARERTQWRLEGPK